MNFKTTYVLFGVLACLLGALLFNQLWRKKKSEETNYILPKIAKENVKESDFTMLEIERFKPTAEKLVFTKEDGAWRLQQPAVRIENEAVKQVIRQLVQAPKI